jgi:Concanavalin A-like lectin/glucanases superfamily
MTATDQFLALVAARGSDARVRRVDSTIPCPCRTPEGFRDPVWHEQTPKTAPVATLLGFDVLIKEDTPVGYWMLDTATPLNDEILGLTLMSFGSVTVLSAPLVAATGKFSASLADVAGTYLECVTSQFVFDGRKPFTVEFWMSATDLSDATIMSYMWASGNKISGWSFQIVSGDLVFTRQTQGAPSQANLVDIAPNTTYHVVGRYDGTELRLYVNGVLRATTVDEKVMSLPSDWETVVLRIGDPALTANYVGRIDEIAIYNKSLAEDRISLHYSIGSAEPGILTGSYQYFITWVDAKGERSAPSPGSVVVVPSNQRVFVIFPQPPAEVTAVKIYRHSGSGPYYYVGQKDVVSNPAPNRVFIDNYLDSELVQQNPPNYICNEAGYLPGGNVIDMIVKAFVQPAISTRRHMPREQFEILFAGDVQEDDHLGIFPCIWSGTTLDFDDWSRSGEDFIEYRGRRFIVVSASMIPDPSNGAVDHHWELGLRLTDKMQYGVS